MDIDILLWLQGLREAMPSFVEKFFVVISAIAINPALALVPCIIYWCIDKRKGTLVMLAFTISSLAVNLIKSIACIYRPWIRSTLIHPSEQALPEATGYSFPSGHTQGATSLIGGAGTYFRDKGKHIPIVCWIFVVLVGFSRCFLGVHTPQDVLVGFLVGLAGILCAEPLLNRMEASERHARTLVIVAIVLAVAAIAYGVLKPYPNDIVDGKLLMDTAPMKKNTVESASLFAGAMLGWYLERRFVGFSADATAHSMKTNVIRVAIGAVLVVALRYGLSLPLEGIVDSLVIDFIKNFNTSFGAMFLAPWVFWTLERKRAA